MPGDSCKGELCPSSLNKNWLLGLKREHIQYKRLNTTCCGHDLNVRKMYFSCHLYLIIVSANGAARRKLCGGRLWGFRGWPPLTGNSKRCPLVTVQGDDASGFVDHVMHAVSL